MSIDIQNVLSKAFIYLIKAERLTYNVNKCHPSDSDLAPIQRQAILWSNDSLLQIGPMRWEQA